MKERERKVKDVFDAFMEGVRIGKIIAKKENIHARTNRSSDRHSRNK